MSGSNNNFSSAQWSAHLETQRKAAERVTPILATQTKNGKKK
jgi:hypothetical protein